MKINNILKDSQHGLSIFSKDKIEKLENSIFTKFVRNVEKFYVKCLIRQKDILLTPEEIVRQLYLMVLIEDYKYSHERIKVEYEVNFGREKKFADIVIVDQLDFTVPYIVIEVKKPKLKDGKEQLRSYVNGTGSPMGVWTNGSDTKWFHRRPPNFFEEISNIPNSGVSLSEIIGKSYTISQLIEDWHKRPYRRSLKAIIEDMEDEVLANAGVDVFEEVFKLVFIKLFDELQNHRKLEDKLNFRNYGESDLELKEKLEKLFSKAKEKWHGIFSDDENIKLKPSHLAVCLSSLQDEKLFNSNLDIIDEAFEYLVNKSSKSDKGQYFTPRYVIDMAVKMLMPNENESVIDTASGSCGFPIHATFYVWKDIYKKLGIEESELFTADKKEPRAIEYVQNKVFGIDFDEKSVRVARLLNLIAGDGDTNVLHLNSLDFERWDENTKDENWQDIYFEGWSRLKKLRTNKNSNRDFNFDVLLANPPFAGDIKEERIIARYDLGKKDGKKFQNKVGRDILFIERNLNMLKSGGRMAIVLPQGRFNNSSDQYIRDFISERARILAVVGLHGNVFKPHTGTKTSVLFVQKWDDEICPRKEDYPIFFATMSKPSKDNSGEKIYRKDQNGNFQRDKHGHLIVDHDLFNHDGLTENGIAEAFLEFAKKENFSFV
jgi:type I restriction enzyme M protein